MKIFRGTETKAPDAPAPEHPRAIPAPAGPAAAAAASPPPVAPPEPPAPDLSAILDANVKEMSEKIARLASSLETTRSERDGFEAKIEQMEERMRKLSSLTEMISAQYNPFVGDAPSEREALPHPEVGLAPPALPPTLPASDPVPAPAPDPAPAAPIVAEAAFGSLPTVPLASPPAPREGEAGVYLWSVPPGFEGSMLLLEWADLLLRHVGTRDSLLALVDYYHNIGWIGDPARDQLLAYADGLPASEDASARDWRASVDVHEKSLLFVEKLRAAASRRPG